MGVEIVFLTENETIKAGEERRTPPLNISMYELKTVSLIGDYGFEVTIEVSDDGSNFHTYSSESATANQLYVKSFRDAFMWVRVKVKNGDTADHTLAYLAVKGLK